MSCLKSQSGASVPSDVMDTRHPQSPVWPSTSFHTDAPCTGPLRAKSKQHGLCTERLEVEKVEGQQENTVLSRVHLVHYINYCER